MQYNVFMRVNTNDCWLWAGLVHGSGYGIYLVKIDGKWRQRKAHRLVYEHEVGEIPQGLVLDHLCRVRLCVNPVHLEAVTIGENLMRGEGLQAQNKRKTHCINGHELTEDNVFIRKTENNSRRCKACSYTTRRKNYRKNYFIGKYAKQ